MNTQSQPFSGEQTQPIHPIRPIQHVAPMLMPMTTASLEPYVDTQQVLPTQFYTGEREQMELPERRLMQAMLVDAHRCYTLYMRSEVPEEKQWHRDAVEWFFGGGDEGDHLFGFENVCRVLDLCPERIRAALRAFRPDPNAPVRKPRKRVRRRRKAGAEASLTAH